eukprot:gene14427-14298_t
MRDQLRSRRKIMKFRRGDALVKRGEEHNTIMLITAGSARVHVSRRFDYVGPGYCTGLLSALTSTTQYSGGTDMSPYSKWQPREVRKFVNRGKLKELPKYRPEDKKVSLAHGKWKLDADPGAQQWFAADQESRWGPTHRPQDEMREDEVQVLIVEDPSSASARAR